MNILVTGHKGYIGCILTPMLTQAGYSVSGIDVDLYKDSLFGSPLDEIPSTTKDIRDIEIRDVTGFDAIIHLAGLSNDPLGDLNPALTLEINHQATIRLAQRAKEAGVRRFLFASSCSVYGASGETMLDETSPVCPVTPYAHSKVMSERDLTVLADSHFSPVFFRCATAHGYSPRIRFDLVINNLVAWAYTAGQVLIKSDGTPWRPFVHIGDICQAFIAGLAAPVESIHNQVFNVGETKENYQIREIAEFVKHIVPGCQLTYAPDGGPDKRCYRVSSDKIASTMPQYKPTWSVRKSISELLEKYTELNLRPDEFEGPQYNRIAHLRSLMHKGKLNDDLRWTR